MLELVRTDHKIDFLGKSKFFLVFSFFSVVASIFIWVQGGEAKYGTDFLGGHELVVQLKEGGDSADIRKALEAGGVQESVVQSFEAASREFAIRLPGEGDAKGVREKVESALSAAFKDKFEVKKTDYVGPTVGKELRRKALLAVIVSLVGILIYITVRFEIAFGIGALAALFHDVIVATGVYLYAGYPVTMGMVAAALTITGYSVNDTIVIFDKVREEITKRSEFDLKDLMNEAVSMMLSRTIITGGLTLFSAIALLTVGGGAIRDLSLFLVAGIIAGCYSTIFIASPITLAWHNFRMRKMRRAEAV